MDLIDSPAVTSQTFIKAIAVLQANYGSEYSKEKVAVLFDMIQEEKWSEAKFNATLKWFLKHKRFASWTVADWFDFTIKVYPEAWYHRQCTETHNPLPFLDRYRLKDGTIVYKNKDGVDIPHLEKLPDWKGIAK